MKSKKDPAPRSTNRKATHDYEIIDRFTAGLVLVGTEVKSLRERPASFADSHCIVSGGEAWLRGLHVAPYSHRPDGGHDPVRDRKLLLTKREIRRIAESVKTGGLTVVPLSVWFDDRGRAKTEIALARGKKTHDKRQSIKDRDQARETDRRVSL
jgi:SsrA-binding protein